MPTKPPDLIYGVDETPPTVTLLLLGLQHIFLVTSALVFPVVIIRAVGGTAEDAAFIVTMSMLAGSIGTVLQTINRKGIGSGYLCPAVCGPSYISASLLAMQTGGLSLLYGMTAVAGAAEALFSRFLHRLRFLFPTEVTGVVVTMVGIAVIPIAVQNLLGTGTGDPFTEPAELFVAAVTLGTMVAASVWGRGSLRLYSVLVGMVVGYVAAAATGVLGPDAIARFVDAPLFAFPEIRHPGWSFDAALLLPFIVVVISSTFKTIGDLTTCQKINDTGWKRPDMKNISGGILADGLSAVVAGLLGGMGQATSSSNVGLSIGTAAASRAIAYVVAAILLVLVFVPKLAAAFVIMPQPVMGSVVIFAVTFIIVTGLRIITSRMLDARRTFVVGLSFIFGLGAGMIPDFTAGMHPLVQPVFASSLSVATVTALVVNLIFRIGIAERQSLVLEPGTGFPNAIFSFFERVGGAWGARPEVIRRAESAVNELMELITIVDAADGPVQVDVKFTEEALSIDARYRGRPLDLEPGPSAAGGQSDDEGDLARLPVLLIRQYADSVRTDGRGGECRVRLHFEH
ncbi:xanthine permease [Methanoculleus sp. Wushi-C6]|uniref:Xanthine permease n=1 Tax=Methanoculleus caldifontis TaxID=2651577 RepID=A0ABU3X3P4_9EURY|nr:solute carrier family 23 protein [Methanoculleus sp. Wushi-C6]MDV2482222.1 xanthine permease [Methanoculleus sp. Wushi-C6]